MALLLFDIDGTLLNTFGSGRIAANESFQKYFGCSDAFNNIPLMGRSDKYIWQQACLNCRVSVKTFKKLKNNLLKAYYQYLKTHLKNNIKAKVCPGIPGLLKKAKKNHQLGLLTGNYKRSGMIKIGHFNLDKYFPIGGFGEDNENRNHIARIAIKRAERYYKRKYKNQEIYIIGDTPFDIECAKSTGTVSIAVATGSSNLKELKRYNPDHLFSSFESIEIFFRIINN